MRSRIVNTVILSAALLFATSALVIVPMAGCSTSQQRTTVNSLYSVGETVDAAFKAYLDEIVAGRVSTNGVPQVAAQYNLFQQVFGAAVTAAALNPSAPPTPDVTAAAASLTSAINSARKVK